MGIAGFFSNVNYNYKDRGVFDDAKTNLNRGRFIDADAYDVEVADYH